MTDPTDPFHIDSGVLRGSFDRAATHYDEAAVLQHEVGQRLLERLDLVRLTPGLILDVGAGTGRATAALARRYQGARVVALDMSLGMLQAARARHAPGWLLCADAGRLPVPDASVDLIFSNLTLQWCNDLGHVFGEFHRVLRPGGLLTFSSFGPDTLKELRASWAAVDSASHVNAFVDMHNVGDALLHTGLVGPVMDVEHFTLTYGDVYRLMRDLKALGAHNMTAARARGLTGKGRLRAMVAEYERYRMDGRLPASYEVVYGHAWAPDTGTSGVSGSEFRVGVDSLTANLRARHRKGDS